MLSDQLFGVLIHFGKQFRHFYKQGKKAFLTSGLALHGRMEALQNKNTNVCYYQDRLALTRYFRAAFTLACSIQARSNSNATLARIRYYRAAIRTRSNSNASLAPLITWLARVKYGNSITTGN